MRSFRWEMRWLRWGTRSLRWAVAFACLTTTLASAAEPKDPLARARLLYNDRQFDAAVAAAEEGRRVPERADSADLIAARAYLERFRASAVPDDLTRARDRLSRINPGRLNPRERTYSSACSISARASLVTTVPCGILELRQGCAGMSAVGKL